MEELFLFISAASNGRRSFGNPALLGALPPPTRSLPHGANEPRDESLHVVVRVLPSGIACGSACPPAEPYPVDDVRASPASCSLPVTLQPIQRNPVLLRLAVRFCSSPDNKKTASDIPGGLFEGLQIILVAVLAFEVKRRSGLGDDTLEVGDFLGVEVVIDGGELFLRAVDGIFDGCFVDFSFAESAVG